MTETKNLKLKTYETTTDGQELVARYIDNTSDNFQKIDEFCKTDTTLSVEGGIADAKTVGDNVSQLKDDLSNLQEEVYVLDTELNIKQINDGWHLLDTGLVSADSSYKLVKYEITSNTMYHIADCEKFQFQTRVGTPSDPANPSRTGRTYIGDGYAIAPNDATHLCVCVPVDGSPTAYAVSSNFENLKDYVDYSDSELSRRIDKAEKIIPYVATINEIDFSTCESITGYIRGDNKAFDSNANTSSYVVRVTDETEFRIKANSTSGTSFSFLKSIPNISSDVAFCDGETGRHSIVKDELITCDIPTDCNIILIAKYVIADCTPAYAWTIKNDIDEKLNKNLGSENKGKFLCVGANGDVFTKTIDTNNGNCDFDLFRCGNAESIPVGDNALSYADFIAQTWDTLLSAYPNEVTKSEIIKDTSNTYSIYKYVFTPMYYKKTVFLCAGMHGDEYEGFWGLYRFMKYLYENGYKHEQLRNIRHDVRFVIIPVLNPWGVQNKQRYNSLGVDPNNNYDVHWNDEGWTHSGSTPFQYNESKAVKLVTDEYNGEFVCHIEFHTDAYVPTKGNYTEAVEETKTFEKMYNLTLDERMHLKDDLNYSAPLSQSWVIYTTKGSGPFHYMEEIRNVPSALVEVGVGGYASSGSSKQMEVALDWITNTILTMINNN